MDSDSAIRDAVETLQPYGGIDQDGKPFGLLFLASLNNADKHRLIQIVVIRVVRGSFDIIPPTDPPLTVTGGQLFEFDWHSGPIEDGTPLFTWTSDIPFFPPEMQVEQALVVTPSLRHDLIPGEYAGCLWTLRRIRDAVERAVGVIESLA